MNPQALLCLISDLYAQLLAAQQENAKLRERYESNAKGDAPPRDTGREVN